MIQGYDEILYVFELQSNYAVTVEEAEVVNIITATSLKGRLIANLQQDLDKKEIEEIFGGMFPSPLKSKLQISMLFFSDLYADSYLKTHSFKEGNYFILPTGTLLHGIIQVDKVLDKRLVEHVKEKLEALDTVSIHAKSTTQLLKCKTFILSLSTALLSIPYQENIPEVINKKGKIQEENIHLNKSQSLKEEKNIIKTAIAKNDISKALVLMTDFIKEAKKEHENDVILLKTSLSQIEMDIIKGELGKDQEYAYKNRLVHRILKLTDLIFD